MKLFKSLLSSHSALLKEVAVSTCLIGGTAGIVFGISAGTFAIHYVNLESAEKRWAAHSDPTANYYSEKINSEWNMKETNTIEGMDAPTVQKWVEDPSKPDPTGHHGLTGVAETQFYNLHKILEDQTWSAAWDKYNDMSMGTDFGKPIDPDIRRKRYDFNSMVIDGATHTSLDRAFNQSLYTGLVDFNQNKIVDKIDPDSETDAGKYNVARTFKPVQDNTTSFVEVYKSALVNHNLVALAGFSHASPLSELMVHEPGGKDGKLKGTVSNPNKIVNKEINQTPFILVDANCPNNQNVASSIFRADQPGFLAALATCQYFYNNLKIYHNHYQNIAVSMYGGVPIPNVVNYMGGFQRGIEFFNEFILNAIIEIGGEEYFKSVQDESLHCKSFKNLVNFSKYKDDIEALPPGDEGWTRFENEYLKKFTNEYSIKIIKLGGISTHFTGGFSLGDAIGISKQLLNRGASAIICVAGPEACDTAQEIVNQNSKCIVIGVDTSLEDSDYQRYHKGCGPKTREHPDVNDPYFDQTKGSDGSISPEANSIIKFSSIKDIRTVARKIAQLCTKGMNWDITAIDPETKKPKPDPTRAICGPGFKTSANILNGLISISWDGFVPLMQALRLVVFSDGTAFEAHWKDAIHKYIEDIGETEWNKLDKDYRGDGEKTGVWSIDELLTFNKETAFYKCYNHTIQILGRVFYSSNSKLHFVPKMSLWHDDDWNIITMELHGENMSISDWLDTNMYFYT